MPLVAPNLDTRTFDQIVAEVRRRIPTFTPEWTDLNESDPGITLAQLFAFMSEQLLFQVNQVPDKGFVTFLQMVGVDLHPAVPAVADVTFIPQGGTDAGAPLVVEVDERTQVQTAAPPPGQTSPLTFETIRAFTALNGSVVDIGHHGADLQYASVLAANGSATGTYRPFRHAASTRDSFFLVLDLNVTATTPAWPAGIFRFRVNAADSFAVGEPVITSQPAGATPRIAWSYSTGVETVMGTQRATFTPITPSLDSTLELTQSGYLEFTFPTGDLMKRVTPGPSPPDLVPAAFAGHFVIRAQLQAAGAYGATPPRLKSVLLNTVTARNLVTVRNEALGASNGRAFQSFTLANAPVYPGSTSITVYEPSTGGGKLMTWTETLDLFGAGPGDRKYELVPDTGEILFGDGITGMIPPPDDGSQPGGNIVVSSYQYGGGLSGNVGSTSLTKVLGSTFSFDANNVLPATGGDDEEPAASGIARAPAVVRSRFRAVSLADFEALAKETPTVRVARAKALPNTRPDHVAGTTPGAVTVILVPNATTASSIHSAIPLPDAVAQAVHAYLDERRLVTAELYTTKAVFRQVTVTATLQLGAGTGAAAALADAVSALETYFHALVGGEDGGGWPFGGTIYFSRVFQKLLDVPGVSLVESVLISLDQAPSPPCMDVRINPGELLYSGQHQISVQVIP